MKQPTWLSSVKEELGAFELKEGWNTVTRGGAANEECSGGQFMQGFVGERKEPGFFLNVVGSQCKVGVGEVRDLIHTADVQAKIVAGQDGKQGIPMGGSQCTLVEQQRRGEIDDLGCFCWKNESFPPLQPSLYSKKEKSYKAPCQDTGARTRKARHANTQEQTTRRDSFASTISVGKKPASQVKSMTDSFKALLVHWLVTLFLFFY